MGSGTNAKSLGEFVIGLNNTDYTPAAGVAQASMLPTDFCDWKRNIYNITKRCDDCV